MKIALCLYGKFNNRLDSHSGQKGFEYIRDRILRPHSADVFIDSADRENKDVILAAYGPWIKDTSFREATDYSEFFERFGIDPRGFRAIQGFRTVENTLAFLESRSRSIELMSQHSLTAGAYDCVIVCRFDLGQLDQVNGKQDHLVSEIGFNPYLDMDFIYSAQWLQHNAGYADQWFFSSQVNIETLGTMFERTKRYFAPDSEYFSWLKNGITHSDIDDEFSNARFSVGQPKDLVSVERKDAVNNHLLHKFFFLESGLYSKSKFQNDFHGIAVVMYTHSDYKDVWPAFFGEFEKYLGFATSNYVLVNALSPEIPSTFTQVFYDDALSYTDRLASGLKKISEDFILFHHEDMIPYGVGRMGKVLRFVDKQMKSGKVEYLRLIRASGYVGAPFGSETSISRVYNRFSRWIFSIQPSVWNREKMITLLESAPGLGIWDFERRAQTLMRKLKIKGATVNQKSRRRGMHHWDSKVYPYIATAIVKGKWNTSEYAEELGAVFLAYSVDPKDRGVI